MVASGCLTVCPVSSSPSSSGEDSVVNLFNWCAHRQCWFHTGAQFLSTADKSVSVDKLMSVDMLMSMGTLMSTDKLVSADMLMFMGTFMSTDKLRSMGTLISTDKLVSADTLMSTGTLMSTDKLMCVDKLPTYSHPAVVKLLRCSGEQMASWGGLHCQRFEPVGWHVDSVWLLEVSRKSSL